MTIGRWRRQGGKAQQSAGRDTARCNIGGEIFGLSEDMADKFAKRRDDNPRIS
jgi:hypothetical protein